ncbi:MAG: glycosyltransferase family 4 protein [Alphaproteobacteria bacterium]
MILQVLPALGSGGAEQGAIDVAAATAAAGGVALVASAGGARVREIERAGGRHITLPLASKSPATLWANAGRLARLIEAEGVDLVHVRSRAPAWSARLACRRTATPFMTTFHGTYNESNRIKRAYNAIMAKGDRVIAISHFIAHHVQTRYGVGEDRLRIIPRGINLAIFDPDRVPAERLIQIVEGWRLADGEPVIVMPGRLTRWKGHEVVIRAVADLGRSDLRCVFVGDGPERYRDEMVALARSLGIESVVQFVGPCRDMAAAYKAADVVVSASTDPEGFGRVVAEGMAMGRPVVASAHGGAVEQLDGGALGWLTPPGDAAALARGLAEALALDGDSRADLARRAMDHVRTHYDQRLMCRRTLAVYSELLAGGTRPEAASVPA